VLLDEMTRRRESMATELQWRVAISICCLSHKHVPVLAELIRYIYTKT
jgi:hypothetical protein